MPDLCRVILLGSTGSIGTQTIEVIGNLNNLHKAGKHPTRYQIVALAAGSDAPALCAQARALGVEHLALTNTDVRCELPARRGPSAAESLVRDIEADLVVSAIVGSAGLPATLAAATLGIDIALANKETLVAAGSLVMHAARTSGARLLPVDSEHSGVWQCIAPASSTGTFTPPPFVPTPNLTRVILTASGGPFRTATPPEIADATPAQALNHPTWTMGPKVSIDSATLTNKALEVIEAHWLFGLPADQIGVLIHPQSIVHALAEFADGSLLAHLAPSDMRQPIQLALTAGARTTAPSHGLDPCSLSKLTFEQPDTNRFPALDLAYRVIEAGGTSGAIFNAANEAAVEAFLQNSIPFGRITDLTSGALDAIDTAPLTCLEDALCADTRARAFVQSQIAALHSKA